MDFKSIKAELNKLDTACLCDASSEVKPFPSEFQPVCKNLRMIGRAYPVNAGDDFLPVLNALKNSYEDHILVIKGSSNHALAGEMFAIEARNKGMAGIIVDGSVRDTKLMKKIGFPIYSRSVCPKACESNTIYEPVNAIKIGELEIKKGDILFGDDDGIVFIPEDSVKTIVQTAKEIQFSEDKIIERLKGGESIFNFLNFDEHMENIKSSKDSRLMFKL